MNLEARTDESARRPDPETADSELPGFARLPIAFATPIPVDGFFTLRAGGCSRGSHGTIDGKDGLNLGAACGDDPRAVCSNRARVAASIGRPVLWLQQVHGIAIIDADLADLADLVDLADLADMTDRQVTGAAPQADAAFSTRTDIALAILVADCLPVVLAARDGSIIGAAHAGWRGLAGGVITELARAMRRRCPAIELMAWLGPRIGPSAFEVGDEVRRAFVARAPIAGDAFVPGRRPGKWFADLGLLAQQDLRREGIVSIHDTGACTASDPHRFWSFRRDRSCGRMAAVVALRAPPAVGDNGAARTEGQV